MALAELTYRESLRDIEACLRSTAGKLYPMVPRQGGTFHVGGCERITRLANLRRFCAGFDRDCPLRVNGSGLEGRQDDGVIGTDVGALIDLAGACHWAGRVKLLVSWFCAIFNRTAVLDCGAECRAACCFMAAGGDPPDPQFSRLHDAVATRKLCGEAARLRLKGK